MSAFITPTLVRRYLLATGWTVEQIGDRLAWRRPAPDGTICWTRLDETPSVLRSGTLKEYEEHGARLGMLAAAEMGKPVGASTARERALYFDIIEAAGLTPEAWEEAKGR